MKVIIVHNYYNTQAPSGENTAVNDEIELLSRFGIDVVPFTKTSDELIGSRGARLKSAAAPVFSSASRRQLAQLIQQSRPDIVHLHNVFPRFGPSIIGVARQAGLPVVQTVHNRRISCIAGIHFRDGRGCTDCVGKRVPWPGTVHACYRGSTSQSLVLTSSATVHYATLRNLDHYFAVSESIAQVLYEAGVPAPKVTVKANPVPDAGVRPIGKTRRALYAGRLEESKGALLLLDAWTSLGPPDRPRLRVCGSGPLEPRFRAAAQADARLEFVGPQSSADVRKHIAESTAVLLPSIGGEGLPRVVAEAFAAGRPVLATDAEPVASVVGQDRGWCVAANARALSAELSAMNRASEAELAALGAAARAYYDREFRPEGVIDLQRRVYETLVARTEVA